jgi:hypothetical protein
MKPILIPAWLVWRSFLENLFPVRRPRRRHARRPVSFGLRLEVLESRTAPAVFNVTTAASLINAIGTADSNSDAQNTIIVTPGSYSVVDQAIMAASTKTLTIIGQGQGVTITANQQDRVFTINAEVAFKNLTITGGKVQGQTGASPAPAEGGGLLIDGGQVTLSNVAVRSNAVTGANGTAAAVGAAATVGQQAAGGGIYVGAGSLTLLNSSISDNKATGGDGGDGGDGKGDIPQTLLGPAKAASRSITRWTATTSWWRRIK